MKGSRYRNIRVIANEHQGKTNEQKVKIKKLTLQ